MLKKYYDLTKPGIIYGNLMTAGAGFLLASKGHLYVLLLLQTMPGAALVLASACVFNNYLDREIDKKMARTKTRALASGLISGRSALIFATALGVSGLLLLAIFTNMVTVAAAIFGFIFYVVVYGVAKRRSVYGTLVGTISGAMPPVIGYTAVSGHIDGGAATLFLIMVMWQMPHFYAIAIYRSKEYSAASIPVLPLIKGVEATKQQMLGYIVGFIIAISLLTISGYTGYTFLAIMVLLGLNWIRLWFLGQKKGIDTNKWARRMFFFSLIVVTSFSVLLAFDSILP